MLLTTALFSALLLFQTYDDGDNAGGTIKWLDDPAAAAEQARKTKKPIMFYVLGRSDDRDDDIERDQKRAMADKTVVGLSKRFICCKLSRSRHAELLKGLGGPREPQMYLVFADPAGKPIGDPVGSMAAGRADSLAQKLAAVFRVYRKALFEKELKATLEKTDAKPAEVKKALEQIDEFTILEADTAVIGVLKREGVDKATEKAGYALLARLSTKPAVEFLLERAADKDAGALKALSDVTPYAASWMIPSLEGEDPDLRAAVYQAMAKVTKYDKPKPSRFWEGKNQKAISDEIQKIKKHVENVSGKWRDRYEEYR
jgi:hypothetical protein